MCEAITDSKREIIPDGGSLPPVWSWKLILPATFVSIIYWLSCDLWSLNNHDEDDDKNVTNFHI